MKEWEQDVRDKVCEISRWEEHVAEAEGEVAAAEADVCRAGVLRAHDTKSVESPSYEKKSDISRLIQENKDLKFQNAVMRAEIAGLKWKCENFCKRKNGLLAGKKAVEKEKESLAHRLKQLEWQWKESEQSDRLHDALLETLELEPILRFVEQPTVPSVSTSTGLNSGSTNSTAQPVISLCGRFSFRSAIVENTVEKLRCEELDI